MGWGIYHDFPYTNATILFPAATGVASVGFPTSFGTMPRATDWFGITADLIRIDYSDLPFPIPREPDRSQRNSPISAVP